MIIFSLVAIFIFNFLHRAKYLWSYGIPFTLILYSHCFDLRCLLLACLELICLLAFTLNISLSERFLRMKLFQWRLWCRVDNLAKLITNVTTICGVRRLSANITWVWKDIRVVFISELMCDGWLPRLELFLSWLLKVWDDAFWIEIACTLCIFQNITRELVLSANWFLSHRWDAKFRRLERIFYSYISRSTCRAK